MNSEELSRKIFEILSTLGKERFFFRGVFVAEFEGAFQIRYVFSHSIQEEVEDIILKTFVSVPPAGERIVLKSLGDVSSVAIWMEQEISSKFPIDFIGGAPLTELSILNVPRADTEYKTEDLML